METIVINLDRRPDRLEYVDREIQRIGLKYWVFEAIDKKSGYVGCRESHILLLNGMHNEPYYLILEDDVKFLEDESVINKAIMQLPSDWDALYLGGSPRKPQEEYSSYLWRANGVYCTHAIVWHNRPNGAIEYIMSHKSDIKKIDDYLATVIQPQFNVFMCNPLVATQEQFQSDTCQRSDVSTIEKNYNKFCR